MAASARNRRRCFASVITPVLRPSYARLSQCTPFIVSACRRKVTAPSLLLSPKSRLLGVPTYCFCRPGGVTPPTPVKGGKNGGKGAQACGPVKARFQCSRSRKTGSRGVPGRTPCSPHGAARYSALYRPDNRTRKCPARLLGAGHFSWAGKPPPRQPAGFHSSFPAAGSTWQGGM